MKKLEESDIIRIMREEWDAKVAALEEAISLELTGNIDGDEKQLISPGLKVWSNRKNEDELGFQYDVVAVDTRGVVTLRVPETQETFTVDRKEFESSYSIRPGDGNRSKGKDSKKSSRGGVK